MFGACLCLFLGILSVIFDSFIGFVPGFDSQYAVSVFQVKFDT